MLLLDDALADDADEHELEHDLLALAVHGGAMRTVEQTDALAAGAGLQQTSRETIGWGPALRRYAPFS